MKAYKGGSPPRGRGRQARSVRSVPCGRLTPARVGTALRSSTRTRRAEAHPRAGGDGDGVDLGALAGQGSPPRGRGRLDARADRWRVEGLTPARAGTAALHRAASVMTAAHPRAGGDGPYPWQAEAAGMGSPPRGRGRLRRPRAGLPRPGLTPARAGTALAGKVLYEPEHGCYFSLSARIRLLAALHPGLIVGCAVPSAGRRIRVTPSKSTGSQSWRCTLKSSPWSPRRVNTITARPSFAMSTTRNHIWSRTFADTPPQNTPGAISRSHRVRCPRSPAGHAVSTMTTTGDPHPSSSARPPPASSYPTARSRPP